MKQPISLLFALTTLSCSVAGVDDIGQQHLTYYPDELRLSLEASEATRMELLGGKMVWSEGDFVSVFYFSDANQKWRYDGATGERTGSFSIVESPEARRNTSSIVVLYPYDSRYDMNSNSCNVGAMLPAVQHYAEDSFGIGSSMMVARGNTSELKLRNVCGWLRLHITGNGQRVESICLRGNCAEQVAGRTFIYTVDATSQLVTLPSSSDGEDGSVGGTLIFDGDIVEEVTLECGGVELSAEATTFYIALPPRSFEQGLTIDIKCADGRTVQKSTNQRVVIQRNHILPMAEFSI